MFWEINLKNLMNEKCSDEYQANKNVDINNLLNVIIAGID